MYKKVITYKDFDGNTVSEPFYFNLTDNEVIKLETKFLKKFGMSINDALKQAGEKQDLDLILSTMELIIGLAYGERVGNKFIKSEENTSSFMSSDAYSSLIFDLIETDGESDNFFKGVMPNMSNLKNRIQRIADKTKAEMEQKASDSGSLEA